jgi:maleate cis-trans isomerase
VRAPDSVRHRESDRVSLAGPGIDYGERLRLGIVVPSGNVIAEPQIRAMLPPGVAPYFTRLRLRGSSESELMAMLDGVEEATALLADAAVDQLVFHCTAVTTFSPSLGADIGERMRASSGIPSMTTAEAITAALGALRARDIVLLTPYLAGPHRREIEFVHAHGGIVLADAALGIDTNTEMARLSPEELFEFVVRHRNPDAQAYFLSCTALRSAEIIEPLERELGRPVLTSNQAMVWHALRGGGIEDTVDGFGRLLRR